jgi:hypothetical protein
MLITIGRWLLRDLVLVKGNPCITAKNFRKSLLSYILQRCYRRYLGSVKVRIDKFDFCFS